MIWIKPSIFMNQERASWFSFNGFAPKDHQICLILAIFETHKMSKSPVILDSKHCINSEFQYGGEGGIRTLASLSQPNGLANRPLQPTWVLLQ